jgi:hypothetical protein
VQRHALGLGVVLLIVAVACTTEVFTGGSTITVNTAPGPTASGSPGGEGLIATVSIAEFGETCPNGGTPAETLPRQVRIGCISDVTCNPRDPQGQVIFNLAITGPAPTSFTQTSGVSFGEFVQDENPYNGTVRGIAAGLIQLQCTVKGVASPPFVMTVVP